MKVKIRLDIEAYPNTLPMVDRVAIRGAPKGEWVAHAKGHIRQSQIGTGDTMQAAVQDLLSKWAAKMDGQPWGSAEARKVPTG